MATRFFYYIPATHVAKQSPIFNTFSPLLKISKIFTPQELIRSAILFHANKNHTYHYHTKNTSNLIGQSGVYVFTFLKRERKILTIKNYPVTQEAKM